MLLVLETLTPTERAVFVLREVFEPGYEEIGEAVGKSPSAVRQLAHRARAHVTARRPRAVVSPADTRAAPQAFQHALGSGDLRSLLGILAPGRGPPGRRRRSRASHATARRGSR
jgi:RNA polymerase sigma-70 factor (ECF subfamily)